MANGGMFVLRNFYVSFCQNFKGELLSRQQRPHTAGLREDIQLITDSFHSPAVLMQGQGRISVYEPGRANPQLL